MSKELFVSFNSPQCGWMSIGFSDGEREFHTTTAYTPHAGALAEIMHGLRRLVEADAPDDEFVILWSRNPEAFDFLFRRDGNTVEFAVFQFPSFTRDEQRRKKVFEFVGDRRQIAEAFFKTFQHLRDDVETDEFEQNWRQPFPHKAFENLAAALLKPA
jgi:hypothetical protein